MGQNSNPISILETCGKEIIRIVTPISICILLVVIFVSILNGDSSLGGCCSITVMATMAYNESSSNSEEKKRKVENLKRTERKKNERKPKENNILCIKRRITMAC